jgi:diaminobutyrate-2-oxoglutarate transaminase
MLPEQTERALRRRLAEWITAETEAGASPEATWSATLLENGLRFEDRPYPVSLAPVVLDAPFATHLARRAEALHGILERALDLYRHEPRIRSDLFREYEPHAGLALAVPSSRPSIRIARFDCILTGRGGFKLLEANTACPGGVIQSPLATRLWLGTEAAQACLRGLAVREQPMLADRLLFVRELVAAARAMGVEASRAAVVNLRGVYTNEVEWIVRGLADLGLEGELRDAREFRCATGWPVAGGRRYDLVYNKFDPLALIGDAEARSYRAAFRAGRACFVNPGPAQLVSEDKAILALLTDERYAALLEPDERELIRRHVPWTRLVSSVRTRCPSGARVDLLEFVAQNKDRLVLKPANLTRGEGVVVGPLTSRRRWLATLRAATRARYVVQEWVPHSCVVGLFLFSGRLVGFHGRASTEPVVNVGRTGWIVPVVVVETARGRTSSSPRNGGSS